MRSGAARPPSTESKIKPPVPAPQDPAQPSRVEGYLKIVIVAGLFAGLSLSPKLWFGDRLYPLTPVSESLKPIPAPLDHILYAALLAILVAIAIVARPARLIGVFTFLMIVMALFDQSRWQPWLYQYLVMLGAMGLYYLGRGHYDDDHHPALNACRLVVVCIYFWSGLQKVHTDFMVRGFTLLLAPFTRSLSRPIAELIDWSGFVVPFIEIALGIGLLSNRLRNYAVVGAVLMHGFILAAIGPWGLNHNQVVWPWTIAMPTFAVILFWRQSNLSIRAIIWPPRLVYPKLVLLFFGIAPMLSFFDLWDGFLSSAIYAGNRNEAGLYVNDALAARLPTQIQQHLYRTNQQGSLNAVFIAEWSLNEIGAPDYPEPRIYKNVARYICTYEQQPSEVNLVVIRRRVLFSPDTRVSYDCPALSAATIRLAKHSGSTITQGQQAPDFQLQSTVGTIHLAEYRGRNNVVLIFVKSAFREDSTDQVKGYASHQSQFTDANAALLVVSTSSVPAVTHWTMEDIGASITIVSDQMRSTTQAYGFLIGDGEESGMPRAATVVIDKHGRVVFVHEGAADPAQILQFCQNLK